MVLGPNGGIRELCELIDEYGEDLEADFTQFYSGLDLSGVWRGQLSPRRALVLVGRLGDIPGSRFRAAALEDRHFIGWSPEASILADLYDALVDNSIVTVKAAGGRANAAEPYPRPTPPPDKPVEVTEPTIDDFPIHMVMAMTA